MKRINAFFGALIFTGLSISASAQPGSVIYKNNSWQYIMLNGDTCTQKNHSVSVKAKKMYDKGMKQFLKGKSDKALKFYNEALSLSDVYESAYVGRALIYRVQGNYEKSLEDYNKAIELEPCEKSNYEYRGDIYMALGKYNKAIDDFTHYLNWDKDNEEVYLQLGKAYIELANETKGCKLVKKSVEMGAEDAAEVLSEHCVN